MRLPRFLKPTPLLLVSALLFWACGGGSGGAPVPTGSRLSQAALVGDLKALADPAMEGRKRGTSGNELARRMIEQRFASLGLEPFGSSFRQAFTSPYGDGSSVVGRIQGTQFPERYLLLTAHFDHLGTSGTSVFCGANDNASGTAAVLQMAGYFKSHPPARSVAFCLFDGEEGGLLGSEAFASAPPAPLTLAKIDVVVNLDMVAQGTKGRIFVGGTTATPSLKPHLLAGFAGSRVAVVPDFEAFDAKSDQHPFQARGLPFLFFCVGDDDPYYHTLQDTFERIPQDFYGEAAEAILATLLQLDAQASLPGLQAPTRSMKPFEVRFQAHPWKERPREQ